MSCKVDGCSGAVFARGLCGKHYNQWRRNNAKPCKLAGCERKAEKRGYCNVCYGKALSERRPVCTFPGCNKPQVARGLCVACYSRLKRNGSSERKKDGRFSHPLYALWSQMKQRCSNPHMANFKYYGAKGVKVCERWQEFWQFAADMGARPSPLHTIERLDGDKDYEPGNCCWALQRQQARNKRNVKLTDEIVRQIKARSRRGEKCHVIAASLALNYQTVNSVINGQSWADVEPSIFD